MAFLWVLVMIVIIILLLVELWGFGTIIGEMPIFATIVAHLLGIVIVSPSTEFVLLGIIIIPFLVQPWHHLGSLPHEKCKLNITIFITWIITRFIITWAWWGSLALILLLGLVITLSFECKIFLGLWRINFSQEEHLMRSNLSNNFTYFKFW